MVVTLLLLLSCREARGCPHQASYEYHSARSILSVTQERWYALYFLDTSLRVDYGWDHAAVDQVDTRIGLGLRLRFLC